MTVTVNRAADASERVTITCSTVAAVILLGIIEAENELHPRYTMEELGEKLADALSA